MKTIRWLFILLFCPAAWGQGVVVAPQIALNTVNGVSRPLANATITVCAANASGIPCTPALAGAVFKDAALTLPLTNPFTADVNGNYSFAVAAGTYTVTVTGAGFGGYSYQLTASCGPGNCTVNNLAASNFNTVLYVGGANASFWGGGDIGSQINAAYFALPPNGGQIIIIPNSAGPANCYTWTTPIVATVASKYLLLSGLSADSQTGATSNGTCLNYTSTSGTAITLDYVPATGAGNGRNHGIQNLRLINNQCNASGGCGSSAVGVLCGSTNAGCQNATFIKFMVTGFGTGMSLTAPSSSQASWGVSISHSAFSYNTTGLSIANGVELTHLDDVKTLGNATGLSQGSSSGTVYVAGSIDSNTTVGVVTTGGDFTSIGTWYENQGSSCSANVNYVNAGLNATIIGGIAHDDCVSGSGATYWFNAPALTVSGQAFATAGRIPTVVYQYSTSAYVTGVDNVSLIPRGNVLATVGGNAVFSQKDNALATIESALFEADSGTAFSCSMVNTISSTWGASAACSTPQGGNQRFSFIMTSNGAGVGANPTLKITLTSPWPVSPLYQCKIVGGTGIPALITGEEATISTNTIGPLIFNGTPAGGGATYQFSCQGI